MHNSTIGTASDSGEAIRSRRMHANEIERLVQQARREVAEKILTEVEDGLFSPILMGNGFLEFRHTTTHSLRIWRDIKAKYLGK